ncbi:hypothetical protein HAP94_13575 [Acidithiobacillus ferrivorans]|nr:hypothetical protein [Acidithiobacillus ferrivorans]
MTTILGRRKDFNEFISAEVGVPNAIEHYCIDDDGNPLDPRLTPKEWADKPIIIAAKKWAIKHGWGLMGNTVSGDLNGPD